MSKEKNIYDYIVKDFKNIVNNIGVLFLIVIFSEAIRKFTLHVSGIPYFVLDSEPLITTFGYGLGFVGAMTSIGIYSFGILLIDKLRISKGDLKFSIIFLRIISLFVSFLLIFYILINTYLLNDDFEKKIYVNSEFRVENGEKYSIIYNLNESNPILYCKKTFFSDNCFTEIKK